MLVAMIFFSIRSALQPLDLTSNSLTNCQWVAIKTVHVEYAIADSMQGFLTLVEEKCSSHVHTLISLIVHIV